MKSKILSILCLALAAITVFASCEDEGGAHTHTFSNSWQTNETHHWRAATCEHGENKSQYGEHTDADENGICDTCEYEMGHTHTFEDVWQSDENSHWKNPTCSHTNERGELGQHADDDLNAECDVCGGHSHTINDYGFCTVCDKQTQPIDETKLGSIVYAVSSRKNHVTEGLINYSNVSRNMTENITPSIVHDVIFKYGTNGTYLERSYQDKNSAVVKNMVQKDWIKRLPNDNATGVTAIYTDGVLTDAQPSSFSGESLSGYYFTVSTLADGHGAEAVLKSIYAAYIAATPNAAFNEDRVVVEPVSETFDQANRTHSFSFNTLVVHVTSTGQGDEQEEIVVYNANYYEVEVSFTYDADFVLTSLEISCDCYTNDAGEGYGADIDFDYDPATGEIKRKANFVADNYTIKVSQTKGERGEVELNDGSEFAPTDFTLSDTNLTLDVGDNTIIKITGTPDGKFMSFIKNEITVKITDKNGNPVTKGISSNLHGYDELHIYPKSAGEYVITLTYKDKVKTVNIKVNGIPLGGEKTFDVVSTNNNAWDQVYIFKATERGTYKFYLPYGVSVATFTRYESDGETPYVETANIIFDYDNTSSKSEGSFTFEKNLMSGQTYKLCFKFRDCDVTYTIGYDEPKK